MEELLGPGGEDEESANKGVEIINPPVLQHSFTPREEGGGSADNNNSNREDDGHDCPVQPEPVLDEEN